MNKPRLITAQKNTWYRQLKVIVQEETSRDVLILGAPGMAKSNTLSLVLSGSDYNQPVRLVCSAAQQAVRLSILAPFLSTPATEDIPVIKAMRDVANHLISDGKTELIVVEDGHYLDMTSAYVLKMLSQSGKIRLVVVSADLNPASGLNEILLSATPTALLMIEPYDLQQLRLILDEKLGRPITTGFLRAAFRITGGIPEIVDAFLDQIDATQTPPPRGLWAPIVNPLANVHTYRARLEDLISRLDPQLVELHRYLANNRKMTVEDAKVLVPQGIAQMITGGFLNFSEGRISARSAALAMYIGSSRRLQSVAEQEFEPVQVEDDIQVSERILSGGFPDSTERIPWQSLGGASGDLLRRAAQEICLPVNSECCESENQTKFSSEKSFEAIAQALSMQSESLAQGNINDCQVATAKLRELDQQFSGRWYPRSSRLIVDVLITLYQEGPGQALQAMDIFANAAPDTWFETNSGLFALCGALVKNYSGDFRQASALAEEAQAEFSLNDRMALIELSAELCLSLSTVRQEAAADVDRSWFAAIQQVLVGADPILILLWVSVISMIEANYSLVGAESSVPEIGTMLRESQLPEYIISLDTVRLLVWISDENSLNRVNGLPLRHNSSMTTSRENLRSNTSSLGELTAEAEQFFIKDSRLHAYLLANRAQKILHKDSDPGISRRLNDITAQMHQDLESAALKTAMRYGSTDETLTDRETEVISCAKEGQSNREIAERLYLSTRTVEGHMYRAFRKLGITTREELGKIIL